MGWSHLKQQKNCFQASSDSSDIASIIKLFFRSDGLDISLEENLIKIVENLDVNPNKFLNFIQQQDTKDRLKDNTQELINRGGFGSPTFFLNENKMYFGQDRITLIKRQLKSL